MIKIEKQQELAPLTTFKIGGTADYLVEVESLTDLKEAVAFAKNKGLKYFVLGGGSNLLVADEGYRGLVIKLANKEISLVEGVVKVGAGYSLANLINFCSLNNLSGLEWAVAIPGTVGGAVYGNAGAYGGEIKDSLLRVWAYDIDHGELMEFKREECNLAYRDSFFKKHKNLIIWEAEFAFTNKKEFDKKKLAEILTTRKNKIPTEPSAGSVFKNLLASDFNDLLMAEFKDKVTFDKLAAAVVIDALGFKGEKNGGAMVSERHANFIINHQEAKASEVLRLIEKIKKAAEAKYKIKLETEIEMI